MGLLSRLRAGAAAIVVVGMFAVACAEEAAAPPPGDSEETGASSDTEAVREAVHALADAYNAKDVDRFLALTTDDALQSVFGLTRADAPTQLPEMGMGDPALTIDGVSGVVIRGDTATADVLKHEGIVNNPQQMVFVRQDDAWVWDSLGSLLPVEVPEGVTSVPLELNEYEILFDDDAVAGGDFSFAVENTGKEPHELVLLQAPDGTTIEELMGDDSEIDMQPLGYAGRFQPGESGNVVLSQALEPGTYVLLCGVPGETGMPHVMENEQMAAFTVE